MKNLYIVFVYMGSNIRFFVFKKFSVFKKNKEL